MRSPYCLPRRYWRVRSVKLIHSKKYSIHFENYYIFLIIASYTTTQPFWEFLVQKREYQSTPPNDCNGGSWRFGVKIFTFSMCLPPSSEIPISHHVWSAIIRYRRKILSSLQSNWKTTSRFHFKKLLVYYLRHTTWCVVWCYTRVPYASASSDTSVMDGLQVWKRSSTRMYAHSSLIKTL